MSYIYLFLIISFSAVQSVCTKLSQNKNVIGFQIVKAASAFLAMAIPGLFLGIRLHFPSLFWGALYGAVLAVSMYSGYRALQSGVMSLTGMIASFSVIIPVLYGIVFCDEAVTNIKISGLICMILSMLFANVKPSNREGRACSGLWLKYVSLTFFSNGICSVLQKSHQIFYPGAYKMEFNIFAMLTCALIFISIGIIKKKINLISSGKERYYAMFAGVSNSLAAYFTLTLTGYENASLVFPLILHKRLQSLLRMGTWL